MDTHRLWVGCCFFDKWTVASLKKKVLCLGPLLSFVFLSDSFFPSSSPSLSPSSLSLHLAPSGSVRQSQLCVVRDHILLTLLQEFWYISSPIDFLSSAHFFFFYRPLPPFHRHLSSYPQNHFHLSSHTNILTEFLLVRGREEKKKEWRKARKWGDGTRSHFPSGGTLRKRPQTNRKIEVYARKVKMRKEVERKINTLRRTHVYTHKNTHKCAP